MKTTLTTLTRGVLALILTAGFLSFGPLQASAAPTGNPTEQAAKISVSGTVRDASGQPVPGAEPHIALAVLQDGVDRVLRQTALDVERLEVVVPFCAQGAGAQGAEQQEQGGDDGLFHRIQLGMSAITKIRKYAILVLLDWFS